MVINPILGEPHISFMALIKSFSTLQQISPSHISHNLRVQQNSPHFIRRKVVLHTISYHLVLLG
jgi:hypothetical protein